MTLDNEFKEQTEKLVTETLELYKNPPDELSDAAREEAKVSTFTNELPPLLKGLEQSIFRNPIEC